MYDQNSQFYQVYAARQNTWARLRCVLISNYFADGAQLHLELGGKPYTGKNFFKRLSLLFVNVFSSNLGVVFLFYYVSLE